MPDFELETLVALGPLVAALLAALERFIPVIPSYVLFVAMGSILVDDWQGMVMITLISAVGSTLGSSLWYGAGRKLGAERCRDWVHRRGRWVFLSGEMYDTLVEKFRNNSWLVVFICQTVPTARIAVAPPAGVVGMPFPSYLVATYLGCLVWNGGLIAAGLVLQTSDIPAPLLLGSMFATVLAVEVCAVLVMRSRRKRVAPSVRG